MVAPVSNTITSTTSATQDLEVFKNYPSEKNLKLIKEKYGSQDEFFKKISEEGYKQGFESVPKPSFDPNLPATDISKETFQRFLDPKGTEVYKGTPLEPYAGTGDLTRNIPTMQSTFPEGQAIPIEEFEKWKTMDKSGVTDLGKSWNQAGGEFAMPTSYPSMSTEEDRIRQAKEAQLYGINAIGRSTGAPTYIDDTHVMSQADSDEIMNQSINGEGKSSIYNKRLNDGMMYSDGEMRKQGFSEDQIKRANQIEYSSYDRSIQFKEEPDHKQRRKEQSQLYGLDAIGKSSGAPQDTMGIKSIETKDDEPWWKKRKAKLLDKIKNTYFPSQEDKKKKAELMDLGDPDAATDPKNILAQWKPMPMEELDEFLEILKRENPDISTKDLQKLANEHGITNDFLTRHGLWKGKELIKKGLKDNENKKERSRNVGLNVGLTVSKKEFEELQTRERILKEGGQRELEKYISGLKKDDKGLEVTIPWPDDRMPPAESGAHEDLALVNSLLDKAEKNKLPEKDIKEVTTNLENQGIKTKGLTDKNMLLIAMGLGMMASQKPGLQGVGEGALTGLKTVLPLMEKKASDFQIVEVDDPDKPGQTKLVKINKKTNESVDLGYSGKGTEVASVKKLKYEAAQLNIDPADLIKFRLMKGDKSYKERIEAASLKIMTGTIPVEADEALKEAKELIDLIDKLSNQQLEDLLKA